MRNLKYKSIASPLGQLKIFVNEHSLVSISWDNEKPNSVLLNATVEEKGHPLLLQIEQQLNEYFLQKRKVFEVPLETQGTPFQKDVWNLLSKIPYGVTWSYKDIASKVGRPKAVRAVGTAIGRNPVPIVIPCHRVIASNGSLAGFAGGLDRKKLLLDLEN